MHEYPFTIRVSLTIGDETREVEVGSYVDPDETHAMHYGGVACRIGRGVARYPGTLTLWPIREGDRPVPRGNAVTTDEQGRRWHYHMGTSARNRQATIIGFADTVGLTNYNDQTRTSE